MATSEFVVQINASLAWKYVKTPEGYIVVCDALKLTLEGDNGEDPQAIIEESLHRFFRSHLEDQTLERFLSGHGWNVSGNIPTADQVRNGNLVRFKVPSVVNAA